MTAAPLTNAGAPDAVLSVAVPIRLQFVHSIVAKPVHCDVNRWRSPRLTVSGKLTVMLTANVGSP
jgi:hypothetical protein